MCARDGRARRVARLYGLAPPMIALGDYDNRWKSTSQRRHLYQCLLTGAIISHTAFITPWTNITLAVGSSHQQFASSLTGHPC